MIQYPRTKQTFSFSLFYFERDTKRFGGGVKAEDKAECPRGVFYRFTNKFAPERFYTT